MDPCPSLNKRECFNIDPAIKLLVPAQAGTQQDSGFGFPRVRD